MKKTWLEILILIVVVAAVMSPALRGGFISDDHKLIESRTSLFSTPGAYRVLPLKIYWWGTSYSLFAQGYYRPWISLTYWFEYKLGGLRASIYHLSNLVIHVANTVLIFLLMRSLLGLGAGFIIAILSAVCPAALTSVGWISGRTDLWATFFVLLFLLSFQAARNTKNTWPHIAASAAFFMALASKEVAIVAPAIAWALDRCSPSINNAGKTSRRERWHYLVLLIPLGIYLTLRTAVTGAIIPPSAGLMASLQWFPFLAEQYLRTMLSVFFPLHYDFFVGLAWNVPGRGIAFILGWIVFLLLIVRVVLGLRRRQLWALGGLWVGVVLFPAYGLNRSFAPIADFYMYLALPGFWLLIIDGLRTLASRILPRREVSNRWIRFTVLPVVLIFAILTMHRLPLLASDFSLWSHMAKRAPWSDVVAMNLSDAYRLQGDDAQAFWWATKATELNSTAWQPHHSLANYHLDQDDIVSAAPHVDKLAEIAPHHYESQVAIARFYFLANHCTKAVETYRRAFQLGPPTVDALFGFGNALACVEEYQAAVEIYRTALHFEPDWPVVHHNLGVCYKKLGKLDKAVAAYEHALLCDPEFLHSYESLTALYILKNDPAETSQAVRDFSKYGGSSEKIQALKQQMMDAGMDTTSLFEGKESNQ